MGNIVQYWSTQANNLEFDIVEWVIKPLLSSPFQCTPESPISLDYPLTKFSFLLRQCGSLTSVLRSFGQGGGTTVPVFIGRGGTSRVDCLQVCSVLALLAYVERTSSLYVHFEPVYPFQHGFMS